MINLLFNLKAVQTGSYKAEVGAGSGSGTFIKSEPKQIVSAPQHCIQYKINLINLAAQMNSNQIRCWDISSGAGFTYLPSRVEDCSLI